MITLYLDRGQWLFNVIRGLYFMYFMLKLSVTIFHLFLSLFTILYLFQKS